MSRQRVVNATAEWGLSVRHNYDGTVTLEFDSQKQRVKIRVRDNQLRNLAEGVWTAVEERQRALDSIKESLRGEQ